MIEAVGLPATFRAAIEEVCFAGRVVYIGSERVEDVTTHPAFRNAARTVASIYDMKLAQKDAMSFEEGGERFTSAKGARRKRELIKKCNQTRHRQAIASGQFGPE